MKRRLSNPRRRLRFLGGETMTRILSLAVLILLEESSPCAATEQPGPSISLRHNRLDRKMIFETKRSLQRGEGGGRWDDKPNRLDCSKFDYLEDKPEECQERDDGSTEFFPPTGITDPTDPDFEDEEQGGGEGGDGEGQRQPPPPNFISLELRVQLSPSFMEAIGANFNAEQTRFTTEEGMRAFLFRYVGGILARVLTELLDEWAPFTVQLDFRRALQIIPRRNLKVSLFEQHNERVTLEDQGFDPEPLIPEGSGDGGDEPSRGESSSGGGGEGPQPFVPEGPSFGNGGKDGEGGNKNPAKEGGENESPPILLLHHNISYAELSGTQVGDTTSDSHHLEYLFTYAVYSIPRNSDNSPRPVHRTDALSSVAGICSAVIQRTMETGLFFRRLDQVWREDTYFTVTPPSDGGTENTPETDDWTGTLGGNANKNEVIEADDLFLDVEMGETTTPVIDGGEESPTISENWSDKDFSEPLSLQFEAREWFGLSLFLGTLLIATVLAQVATFYRKRLTKKSTWGATTLTESGVGELLNVGWRFEPGTGATDGQYMLQVYDKTKLGYNEDNSMLMGGVEPNPQATTETATMTSPTSGEYSHTRDIGSSNASRSQPTITSHANNDVSDMSGSLATTESSAVISTTPSSAKPETKKKKKSTNKKAPSTSDDASAAPSAGEASPNSKKSKSSSKAISKSDTGSSSVSSTKKKKKRRSSSSSQASASRNKEPSEVSSTSKRKEKSTRQSPTKPKEDK